MYWFARSILNSCRSSATSTLSVARLTSVKSVFSQRNFQSGREARVQHNSLHNLLKTMKKREAPHLRHLKYRDKVGGEFPVPSTVDVQVVGSGGRGTPSCLLLTTSHSKYLFNCGEGTQRIATEFKMKLSKLENIFITDKKWDNIGGLLGMGLTLESMKVPKIIIHGPPGVEKVMMMAKGFAESTSMTVEKKSLEDGCFEDNAFKIDYVPLYKTGSDTEPPEPPVDQPDTEEPASKKQKLTTTDKPVAVSYICWPRPPQRNIILEKCVDLGIRPGPVFRQLKNEESVTLENGTVVHPDQVLSDPEVVRPILVVDCPSEEYLDSLGSNPQLSAFHSSETNEGATASLVVHMTPAHVFISPSYQLWMDRFNGETEHLVLNEMTSDLGYESMYRYQTYLHQVHSSIFPHLRHLPVDRWQAKCGDEGLQTDRCGEVKVKEGVVAGCANLCYRYRPRKGFDREQCIQLDHVAYLQEVLAQKDTEQALKSLQQHIGSHSPICSSQADIDSSEMAHNSLEIAQSSSVTTEDSLETALKSSQASLSSEAVPNSSVNAQNKSEAAEDSSRSADDSSEAYPRLTFLGTGSSVPSKGRNVSGLLVHLRDDATLILDCGEGTSGQLYRHFGDQSDSVLRNLKAVFISHLHADHHMGFFSLLRDRKMALEAAGEEVTRILLLAPIQMSRWLKFYHHQVEPIHHLFELKSLQDLMPHKTVLEENSSSYTQVLQHLSLSQFLPVEVDHCPNAFGVSLTHTDGWKLVFSGDTMPCQRLVVAGEDCDILVHEATHEDDLAEECKRKRHSTISQAIDIGQRMRAKFILLNHFSQRYAKIPMFTQDIPHNVGIAFDHMTVSRKELPLLPHFIPVLKTLFAEEHAVLEAKMSKRHRTRELEKKRQSQS